MENVKAYPSGQHSSVHTPYVEPLNEGMDLRDYFAGQALAGVLSNVKITALLEGNTELPVSHMTAELTYDIADAMMQARSR